METEFDINNIAGINISPYVVKTKNKQPIIFNDFAGYIIACNQYKEYKHEKIQFNHRKERFNPKPKSEYDKIFEKMYYQYLARTGND